MSKILQPIDILTDTWQTVITRVNSLIDSLSTEVVTANGTLSETGSLISPRNARLYGIFSANTLATNANTFMANNTTLVIGNQLKILANNSIGTATHVLSSGGASGNVYWAPIAASVTSVANGAGLIGGPITTTGTLSVKANNGITVDSSGVSVKSYNGITVDTNGVSVKANNGIIVNSGGVSAKAGNNIVIDTNGISTSANVVTIGQFENVLNSSTGYTKLPNGVILQWGYFTSPAPGSSKNITLPTTYSNSYKVVFSSQGDYDDNDDGNEIYYAVETSTSYFTFYNATPSDDITVTWSYFTIGY